MARWNVISNISNGGGLQRDTGIIGALLAELGHEVACVQFNACSTCPRADVNLFLETVVPSLFQRAKKNLLVPNPEWFLTTYAPHLGGIDRVLCKTHDAERLFTEFVRRAGLVMPVEYLGWMSPDFMDVTVPRHKKYLHIAGRSAKKNTEAIVQAWQSGRIRSSLTIVSEIANWWGLPNVTIHRRLDEPTLRVMMNMHLFHLCPSHYEGWGHSLHEALGVGALVLTTEQPPMNEFFASVRVGVTQMTSQCLAQTWTVPASEIIRGIAQLELMSDEQIEFQSRSARAAYERDCVEFRGNFQRILGEVGL